MDAGLPRGGQFCPSRRSVLVGVGSAAGILTLAACGGGDEPGAEPGGGVGTTSGGGATSDGQSLVALADVPVGGAVSVTTSDGAEILVSQPTEGQVMAFSAVCTHQGCAVAPAEELLRCPCHGSEFDLATGEAVNGPAEDPLPTVPVRVEDGQVVAG